MQKSLFLFVLITASLVGEAQPNFTYQYRHFTSKDGLPSTELYSAFEDSRGHIWVISDRGAARYDGYNFTSYTTKNGMPSNNVLLINEDNHGHLWFMCSNGQFAFLDGDSIYKYKGNERIKKLCTDILPGPFYFDEGDTLWITSFSGTQLFKCTGDSVSEYQLPATMSSLQATYYMKKVGNKLLSLQLGDPHARNELLLNEQDQFLMNITDDRKLACSIELDSNRWLVAGPNAMVVFDDKGTVVTNFNESPFVFGSMEEDRDGNIWLTNSNGAYRMTAASQDPATAEIFFEGHYITSVVQDRAGNYWFTDRDNGLFFLPGIQLRVIKTSLPSKQNKIISLKVYDDKIHFADVAGQVYVMENTDSVASILKQTPASGVSLDFVKFDSQTFLLGKELNVYNIASGSIATTHYKGTIRKSINLQNGDCAFALSTGLGIYTKEKKWKTLDSLGFKERCQTVYADKDNVLWLGSTNGLFSYNGKSITKHSENNEVLNKARVMDIVALNNHTLVLATRNKGIVFFHKNGNTIVLNESNGLISDLVDCVFVEDEKTIWAGTGQGLTRIRIIDFEKQQYDFFQIDAEKGLPSNEVNDMMLYKDKMYVATNDGLCVFDASIVKLNDIVPDISITSFKVNTEPRAMANHYDLKYFETNLRIDFSAICYRTGGNTTYRYKLVGVNDQWIVTNDRSVQFISLPPGDYVFDVSAKNEDGVWNNFPASVSFHIDIKFTQTWWFLSLIAFLVLSIIIGIAVFFIRLQKKEHAIQTKMNELKHQAFSANMNPHFIFNSLNSIQHYINKNNILEANDFMADFSRLIRMNMETTRHSLVPLQDELERLELYLRLEKSRFGEKLQYSINLDSKVKVHDTMLPPMLLQPYVENAIWHGILPTKRTGHIQVNVVSVDANEYKIEIVDDGVGFNKGKSVKTAGHNSLSMGMNSERLRLLKQSTGKTFAISVVDLGENGSTATGTKVTFVLPIDLAKEEFA